MVLIPPFTPQAVQKLEPQAVCAELIGRFIDARACDAAVHYAQHIPVRIIAHVPGIPAQDGDQFRRWITMALQDGITNEAILKQAEQEIAEHLTSRSQSADNAQVRTLSAFYTRPHPAGRAVFRPGDSGCVASAARWRNYTTWSAIGSALWHLATHAEDRRASPD
jgi:cytochrome P450